MKLDDPFDAINARLAAYCQREAVAMAREVLSADRVNFSITTFAALGRVADGHGNPGLVDTRRVASAWSRWVKAGLRQARRAARSP